MPLRIHEWAEECHGIYSGLCVTHTTVSLHHGCCQRQAYYNKQSCPCSQVDYTRRFDVEHDSYCTDIYLYTKHVQTDILVTLQGDRSLTISQHAVSSSNWTQEEHACQGYDSGHVHSDPKAVRQNLLDILLKACL